MRRIISILFLFSGFVFGQNPGDLIITEWMADPSIVTDALGEYFEIYNTTGTAIDINGFVIKDDGSNLKTVNVSVIVPASGFATLAASSTPGFTPTWDWSSTGSGAFGLNNSGADEIVIMKDLLQIARVNYTDGTPFGAGVSAELNDITNHTNGVTLENNYITAINNYNGDLGSPGLFGETLPVELTTFSALILDNLVKLKWQTATEVNNYGFNIERKSETGDWNKVGFVEGHGNSNSPKNYIFVDNTVLNTGKYFYRLKQVDIDGTYEYSIIVKVDMTTKIKFKLSQNFPNPFNPNTSIQFSLSETSNTKLVVFNIIGEQVAELLNENVEAGYHNIEFNASELNSGIYIYKLEANGFVQLRKMILVK